ncbi:Hypothetical predicted protein [Octopus vulgaris]|uniref:Major facilitator superfamily associated domain-containing protein n=1 Tax=Octopus vulgaris TaxID=6645 RepID=A0AA36ALL5_OCTVU|nr:Hypothetical predicted protein [Octopus vulgaris]
MNNPNTINLPRAIFIFNVFHLFFAAAKASLFPFLTLFYRHLGLSATQTGYLMAAKMLSTFIWVPVWTKYSIKLKKRRLFLIFSIIMMLATNLSIWLVSGSIDTFLKDNCLLLEAKQHMLASNATLSASKSHQNVTQIFSSTTEFPNIYMNNNETQEPDLNITDYFSTLVTNPLYSKTSSGNVSETTNATDSDILRDKYFLSTETLSESEKLNKYWSTSTELPAVLNGSLQNYDTHLKASKAPQEWVKRNVQPQSATTPLETSTTMDSTNGSWNMQFVWQSIKAWIQNVKGDEQTQVFFILLTIILIGEIFGSAAEKISDDCWYDLLDSLDILEKYGSHRIWSSLAFLLVPTGVAMLVDHTQCQLPVHMNHILIHCFAFAAFLTISLFFSFVFPSPTFEKCVPAIRHRKGIEVTCFGCHGFVYMMTVFVMGAVYSTISNFLFWYLEDIGSNETIMGLCILVNTFSEIPVLLYGDYLVRYLGPAGTTCFSMVFCSIRVFVYSFVYSPWYFLPLEVFHALTHTTLWYAVFSNPIFNISPDVDRTIRNILSSVYFGIGFSAGSIASGYVVGSYGIAVLFRVVAGICLVWCIVFFFIEKYMPREKSVRYQRLLQMDEGNNSDDSSAVEADWLEQALKSN